MTLKITQTICAITLAATAATSALAADPQVPRPIAAGPFQASWQSLEKYECPQWFRDAKFGLWAHWGGRNVFPS